MAFWVPLIALAAGTALAAAGAEKSKNAMNKATFRELERQRKFREQGSQRFAQSLSESTPEKAQSLLQEGRQMSEQQSKALQSVPLTQGSSQQGDGVVRAGDAAEAQRGNKARAAMAAYPWWTLNQAMKDIRTNQELMQLNDFAQGSQRVLPLEIDHASHAGDTLSGIGQLVSTLGSLYGMGSAMAAPGAAAGSVGATGAGMLGAFGPVRPDPMSYGIRSSNMMKPLTFGF